MKTKNSIKDIIYGSMSELMENRKFFYKSSISKWEYSHWTDEGKDELLQLMHTMSIQILKYQEKEIEDKAKDMVMDKLKGN
jgi:trimethylamine:corrinoid methyltransferase-like protein